MLEQAVRARDDFLSMASHELKTPLTALKMHLQGALRASAEATQPVPLAQYRAKLQTLERNTSRLAGLVENMLDISRISAGRLELTLSEVDLGERVREVAGRFHEEAARAGCALALELPPSPVVGHWDRERVDQVLTNLLTNALKYGRGQPVEVRVRSDDTRALLEVRDRGIGISAEHHQRIFERFERAAAHTECGGFGVGLWIVRQVVQGLGGRVTVDSRPGQGATFRVELPLACSRPSASSAETA
jgi:signal transduction histidine kinase